MLASTSAATTSGLAHKPGDAGAPQRPGSLNNIIYLRWLTLRLSGVMARLHGLFPNTNHEALADGEGSKTRGTQRVQKSKPSPKYLKIRMLTWNMHDSVPKVSITTNSPLRLNSYRAYPG